MNQVALVGSSEPIQGSKSRCSRNQEVELGLASLTITLNDPVAEFVLSVPTTLYLLDLEILIPRGALLPRKHIKYFTELELNYF